MKRSYFLIASLSIFSSAVFSQFESSDKQKDKGIDYSILDAEVGKNFWIKANPKAILRIEFGADLGSYGIQDKFVVTDDIQFSTISWKLDDLNRPYFLIKFINGKLAYLPVNIIWQIEKKAFRDMFDETRYFDHKEYIFRSEPNAALLAWRKKSEDESKRAEAEFKSKGGVRVGMTKEQVLKSHWGAPNNINRTVMVNGTSEQWVYGQGQYLYFTNNILTTIQN